MSGRFRITCPKCGREGGAKSEPSVGAKVRCPGCKAQFAYARDEDFVVVEDAPGVKPSEPAQAGPRDDVWISFAIVIGAVMGAILLATLAANGPSVIGGLLSALVLAFVVASPFVLVGCLIYLLIKAAIKHAIREADAERPGP